MKPKDWIISSGVVLALIIAIAVGVGGNSQSLRDDIKLIGQTITSIQEQLNSIAGSALIGGTTRFPNSDLSAKTITANETLTATGAFTASATSTLQEITLGSRFSKALTFTAGVTTTPGGLFALQNTGADKICNRVEVDISSNAAGSATMVFSVATSTSASALGTAKSASIIATSTVATTTLRLMNSYDEAGTSAMYSFIWSNGLYLLGTIEDGAVNGASGGQTAYASSSGYTSMVGNAYVTCHSR